MELNDNDRQRIEQQSKLIYQEDVRGGFDLTASHQLAFKFGAEYATMYEREQQAPLLRELEEFKNGNLMDEYTVELSDKVERLEAERTELRNKVIEDRLSLLVAFGALVQMKEISNLTEAAKHFLWDYDNIKNSLKTK